MKIRKFKVGDRVYHEYDRIHFATVIEDQDNGFYKVRWDPADDDTPEDAAENEQVFVEFNLCAVKQG